MAVAALAAGTTAIAIVAGLALDGAANPAEAGPPAAAGAAPSTATPESTLSVPTATASAPDPAVPIVRSAVAASDGTPAGPVTGGTVVTVTGTDLAGVTSATFGANPATVVSATVDTVTLRTPAATGLSTGSVDVRLFAGAADPVQVVGGINVTGAAVAEALEPAKAPIVQSDTAAAAAPALSFTYVPDARITAQIDYALAHWQNYNSAVYGFISGNDCVNFTSQSLIARGWTMDADWSYGAGSYSAAWASSTAFAAYLSRHPERATPLTAGQRDQVKVGDIVQFDWDDSGDKDHTGIVTRVDHTAGGVEIYYAGHTADTVYRSVDESLARGGGSVSYWSVM